MYYVALSPTMMSMKMITKASIMLEKPLLFKGTMQVVVKSKDMRPRRIPVQFLSRATEMTHFDHDSDVNDDW